MAADAEESLLERAVGRELRRVHDPVDAPVHHDRDVFRHSSGHPDVLLDDQDRDLALLADPDQHVLDLLHDHRREPLGRLVHHQQARVEQQCARYREHLLLAARELSTPVRTPLREPRESIVDTLPRPSAAGAAFAQPQVLVHRERRPQPPPLRHIPDPVVRDSTRIRADELVAFELNGAVRDRHEPHDRVAQRGLAHTVTADDGDDPVREIEIDPLQRMGLAVVDVKPPDPERCRLGAPSCSFNHGRPEDEAPFPVVPSGVGGDRRAQP